MKGRLNGVIKSMTRDNAWVYIIVETTGAVIETKLGQDSKSSAAEIKLRMKPIMGDQLKFGDKIYFTWSTEAPEKDERE